MLQDNKDQKIYVPIIEIDYAAKRFTQDVSSFEKVSFGVKNKKNKNNVF